LIHHQAARRLPTVSPNVWAGLGSPCRNSADVFLRPRRNFSRREALSTRGRHCATTLQIRSSLVSSPKVGRVPLIWLTITKSGACCLPCQSIRVCHRDRNLWPSISLRWLVGGASRRERPPWLVYRVEAAAPGLVVRQIRGFTLIACQWSFFGVEFHLSRSPFGPRLFISALAFISFAITKVRNVIDGGWLLVIVVIVASQGPPETATPRPRNPRNGDVRPHARHP
jgi:hypothetical protein